VSRLKGSSMLKSGKGADFKITCNGQAFNVHSLIICPRSDYFTGACEAGFKVSFAKKAFQDILTIWAHKETGSHTIDLPEMDPLLVGKTLEYLYTLDYFDGMADSMEVFDQGLLSEDFDDYLEQQTQDRPAVIKMHVDMITTADFLGIKSLQWMAFHKFESALEAWRPNDNRIIVSLIRHVFTNATSSLCPQRATMLHSLSHARLFALLKLPEFKELMNDCPEFAFELVEYSLEVLPRMQGKAFSW